MPVLRVMLSVQLANGEVIEQASVRISNIFCCHGFLFCFSHHQLFNIRFPGLSTTGPSSV